MEMIAVVVCFCFFKQKTAYEMRISDWSSDVCSSDLVVASRQQRRSIRREGDGVDVVFMAAQHADFAPGIQIPQAHRPVPAGGGGEPTVGRNGDRRPFSPVLREAVDDLAGIAIPKIGRAHVLTPVTNSPLVCRSLLATN